MDLSQLFRRFGRILIKFGLILLTPYIIAHDVCRVGVENCTRLRGQRSLMVATLMVFALHYAFLTVVYDMFWVGYTTPHHTTKHDDKNKLISKYVYLPSGLFSLWVIYQHWLFLSFERALY